MAEYIEREAALALLKDDREVCADSKEELKYIREDIRLIPAADVRPVVHGKWVQVMGKYDWMVKCSRCNGVPIEISNFCPYCGADMRGDDDGT